MVWDGIKKYAVISIILIWIISCEKDEQFRKKIKPIKEGMHLKEINNILGKPKREDSYTNYEGTPLIVYFYETKGYDPLFKIVFSKKDSLVISYGFEDPLLF